MKFFRKYGELKEAKVERTVTVQPMPGSDPDDGKDPNSPKAMMDAFFDLQWTRINKAQALIYTKHGFFANLLTSLGIIETLEVETMATDGNTIYYNPFFAQSLTIPEITWVLMHEIMHCVLLHMTRRGTKDPLKWNYAGDYAINLLLGKKNMPEMALYDEKFLDMTADQIYDIIPQPPKPPKGKGGKGGGGKCSGKCDGSSGDPSDGSGSGTCTCPSDGSDDGGTGTNKNPNVGEVVEPGKINPKDGKVRQDGNSPKRGDNLDKEWEKKRRAASKSTGGLTGNLKRLLDELNRPKINWKAQLKRFIKHAIEKTDYAIPYKRFIHDDMYLPGPVPEDNALKNVVLAVDTSGSVSTKQLTTFVSEIKGILKSYTIQDVYLIAYDHNFKDSDVKRFRKSSQLKLGNVDFEGGGGTSFVPAFDWTNRILLKRGKKLGVFIYFTDSYEQFPPKKMVPWHRQVIWFVVNSDYSVKIPFGHVIHIQSKDFQ